LGPTVTSILKPHPTRRARQNRRHSPYFFLMP
jgi:hypothetical protein